MPAIVIVLLAALAAACMDSAPDNPAPERAETVAAEPNDIAERSGERPGVTENVAGAVRASAQSAAPAGQAGNPSGDEAARGSAEAAAVDAQVREWMAQLGVEQKARLVSGSRGDTESLEQDVDRVPGAAGYTVALPEFGIRDAVLADGPAGLRILPQREDDAATYYATAFPVATALASTWDVELVEQVGVAMGEEIREYGVDVFLAPGMNLHRNPLGGRNFEYFSEDPLLSGTMAAAVVNGVESNGVGATIKHYLANNQETNRQLIDTLINERTLREIYLRGWEIAVERSQPWAIMSAYNQINGSPVSESRDLLTTVLRDEWGFEGVVMTDWFAGDDPVAQMKAGNNLLMPGVPERSEAILRALETGELTEAELDVNVERVLTMVARSRSQQGYAYSNEPDLEAHAATARAAAAEGTVLLKNDGAVLPLADNERSIAAFGATSYEFIAGGSGSGDVNEAYTVSLVQGLEEAGFAIDAELAQTYADYRAVEEAKLPEPEFFFELVPLIPEMPLDPAAIERAAQTADLAVITIGRSSGEFQDREIEGDFDLTEAEQTMLADVSAAFRAEQKKVIVILNVGNVIETASWREHADAIILPWQGGQEAGHAVVDVLTGRVNPSGKLPTSFPLAYSDVPSAASAMSFPGIELSDEEVPGFGALSRGRPAEVEYRDGLFVGYRYYDTFGMEPAWPFGHGLSYTTFTVEALQPTLTDSGYRTAVTVTNTGEVAGKEVVQVYVEAPSQRLVKPVRELRAYAKTALLEPGQSQTVEIDVGVEDLASFDSDERAWIVDPGEYGFHVATSSREIHRSFAIERADALRAKEAIADLRHERVVEELRPVR